MDLQLKPISEEGIPEAISKAELYRYLNEPGEAESICRDILVVDAENQMALRQLGLALTDQFSGASEQAGMSAWMSANLTRGEIDVLRTMHGPLALFRRGEPLALMPFTFLR